METTLFSEFKSTFITSAHNYFSPLAKIWSFVCTSSRLETAARLQLDALNKIENKVLNLESQNRDLLGLVRSLQINQKSISLLHADFERINHEAHRIDTRISGNPMKMHSRNIRVKANLAKVRGHHVGSATNSPLQGKGAVRWKKSTKHERDQTS
ncbi:MAG: hypothetical protein MJK10_03735 [Pseudomonadales bacterium]|nr:hypothetical protein [Pseudomonadales bacterium]NRA15183.1 hypothetical protein [Oceanospirillaceae bacterium]